MSRLPTGLNRAVSFHNHISSLESVQISGVETTFVVLVVLVERERKVGGNPGYVTRKDAVTISPVHAVSVARRITAPFPAYITPCRQPYEILMDTPTSAVWPGSVR